MSEPKTFDESAWALARQLFGPSMATHVEHIDAALRREREKVLAALPPYPAGWPVIRKTDGALCHLIGPCDALPPEYEDIGDNHFIRERNKVREADAKLLNEAADVEEAKGTPAGMLKAGFAETMEYRIRATIEPEA